MIVIVTTQMRTGSTWLCHLLCDILNAPKWTFAKSIPHLENVLKRFKNTKGNYIIKMHQVHPNEVIDKCDKVVSITRDVKDVIVSRAFFQNKNIQKRNPNNGKIIVNSFFKREGIYVVDTWKRYNDGYEHKNYLLLKYEELKSNTKKELKKICCFLGVVKTDNRLANIVRDNSFSKLAGGRKPGNEASNSFHRKGIVGDWKNYINKENLEIIRKSLDDTE